MTELLSIVQSRFRDRIDAPRWWTFVAFTMPRGWLALALTLVPGALLLLAVATLPPAFGKAATEAQNVHETFARFISAVATASAIAVSIASLSFRGELRGVRSQQERHEATLAFRDRVRKASGHERAPIALASFLAFALDSLRASVASARRVATREELDIKVEGVALGSYLDVVESLAHRSARKVVATGRSPTKLAGAAYDFEEEITTHLARQFARDERLSGDTQAAMDDVRERLHDIVTGTKYAKTLGMSYGMGRMSLAIALSALPAILAAAAMVLTYGEGARDAFGRMGAAAIVSGALVVVVLPLAIFVAYIVRFLFLNQHSLPTDSFVLGPEEPEAFDIESHGATRTLGTGGRRRDISG